MYVCIYSYPLCWWWLRSSPGSPCLTPFSEQRHRCPDSRWSIHRWSSSGASSLPDPLLSECKQGPRVECPPTRLTWPCPHLARSAVPCWSPDPMTKTTTWRARATELSTSSPGSDNCFLFFLSYYDNKWKKKETRKKSLYHPLRRS